ncbi:MAG: ankyrin repeat domain-containing protein [Alphaproteobacteria bacterium GM7ARS4]|nr:ankyrin repeat domain-containing protein [Alphaproteobacteria bacterium GM7ARS4]
MNGDTALHEALREGNPQRVERLLADGVVDVHARDKDGRTPLHCAVYKGNLDVIRLLLDGGADVNAQNVHGNTALHCAVYKENLDVITLLLSWGADVNAWNKLKSTPLDDAERKYLKIAPLLQEAGGKRGKDIL